MSVSKSPLSISKFIDGFPVPPHFPDNNFRSAVHYEPQPDDIFLVTYPKCGSTWVQHIVMFIFRYGQPFDSPDDIHDCSPFLEKRGAGSVETMKRPGAIKTHLPFHLVPWSPENKYIYVARNPKDCCVSYYHHTLCIPNYFRGSFDEYFEMFLAGVVDFGDYFDHLLGWYAHRNDPNVLFITYEELKEDFESCVMKIATFLDAEKYAEPIRKNPEIMESIQKYSSFDFIKAENLKKAEESKLKCQTSDSNPRELSIEEADKCHNHHASRLMRVGFFRKGIVGDWRNYFSEDQTNRLKKKFTERTKGTDLEDLWAKYM